MVERSTHRSEVKGLSLALLLLSLSFSNEVKRHFHYFYLPIAAVVRFKPYNIALKAKCSTTALLLAGQKFQILG